jgi:Domain of unknown function (DUF4258)
VAVRLHPHARARALERGAGEDDIIATVEGGELFPARFGRQGFRRNFPFAGKWLGRAYRTKQLEVYAVEENGDWLVITVIVKYF